jgi:NAD(P)H-hydrate epimerase
MKIVTGAEMRRIDEATIQRFVTGIALMERAGQRVFERVAAMCAPVESMTVSIVLGRGNNAGDGLVVARLLAEAGASVILLYLHRPEELSPDAAKNHARLAALRDGQRLTERFLYLGNWRETAVAAIEESDCLVDALLGTGLAKPVGGEYAEVIDLMNGADAPIVSIDVPSGVNADTGEVMGTAVVADATVTLGLPKIGCLFYPGKECAGELVVGDIGIPREVVDGERLSVEAIDFETALDDLPHHEPTAHKFARGSLLLVAGSRRYAGAAALAATSALRTGAGIVYCAGPESIRVSVQSAAPEIVFVSLPETASGSIDHRAAERVLDEVRFDALAVGPGLTVDRETAPFVPRALERCSKPLLLDADALNALAGKYELLQRASRDKEIVVTPHSGELVRLAGTDAAGKPMERIEKLRSLVAGTWVTIVHKGAPTVVAHHDGTASVNMGGHPGMATAGSGDVLTGAIAGFLAQGCGAARAARLGVYLHSRAAEIAASSLGERGMIARDMVEALPLALRELE